MQPSRAYVESAAHDTGSVSDVTIVDVNITATMAVDTLDRSRAARDWRRNDVTLIAELAAKNRNTVLKNRWINLWH